MLNKKVNEINMERVLISEINDNDLNKKILVKG